MKGIREWMARWVSLAAVVITTSCGGGGGGGGGGGDGPSSPGTPASTVFSAVSISLQSPATIRDATWEGLSAHQAVLTIGYAGDVSALAGRTVYAKVVQTEPVYFPDSTVHEGIGASVTLSLSGSDNHKLPAGRSTGTLQVFACLDPDCRTQLQNSPLLVDYDIEVRPALGLSTEAIVQSVDYGTTPPPVTLTVTVPAEATTWGIGPLETPVGAQPISNALVPQWLHRNGNVFTFQPPADLLPGVFAQVFQLDLVVTDLKFPSVPQRLVRKLLVSHTVKATGAYAINPSFENITLSAAALDQGTVVPDLVSQVGGGFSRRGVRTDAFPAAAVGNPMLANWLAFYDIYVGAHIINYCDRITQVCLPFGTYRGALLLRHTAPDGTQTDFEFPVSFTYTP